MRARRGSIPQAGLFLQREVTNFRLDVHICANRLPVVRLPAGCGPSATICNRFHRWSANIAQPTSANTISPTSPPDTPLRQLVGAIKARWVWEQAHQQLKEELGLDHFEDRSGKGLHRHARMSMIAFAFLQSLEGKSSLTSLQTARQALFALRMQALRPSCKKICERSASFESVSKTVV